MYDVLNMSVHNFSTQTYFTNSQFMFNLLNKILSIILLFFIRFRILYVQIWKKDSNEISSIKFFSWHENHTRNFSWRIEIKIRPLNIMRVCNMHQWLSEYTYTVLGLPKEFRFSVICFITPRFSSAQRVLGISHCWTFLLYCIWVITISCWAEDGGPDE